MWPGFLAVWRDISHAGAYGRRNGLRLSSVGRYGWDGCVAGCIATVVATVGFTAVAPVAQAGTVRVTGTIVGAGGMFSTEGGPYACQLDNGFNHNASSSCGQGVFSAAFEAWVWLRAQPSTFPAGDWEFVRWDGCDATRATGNGVECAVHSGASRPTTATRSPSSATSGRRR